MNFWRPVSKTTAICFFVIYLGMAGLFLKFNGYVPVLDDANLLFHEAGHPIFGAVSAPLGVYGGTLGQLVFPILVMFQFWWHRDMIGFIIGQMWFAENLLNIARYMADAREQFLPLIGGGEHDWTEIFTRWNMLEQNNTVALDVRVFAWLIIGGSGIWLLWQVFVHRNITDGRRF
jgi:hypothetical protein